MSATEVWLWIALVCAAVIAGVWLLGYVSRGAR